MNAKCEYFQDSIKYCLDQSITTSCVQFTERDKSWMSPVSKDLINKRWAAFRQKDFSKFRHYKEKVKEEIARAKSKWILKAKNANIWKMVRSTSGKIERIWPEWNPQFICKRTKSGLCYKLFLRKQFPDYRRLPTQNAESRKRVFGLCWSKSDSLRSI